MSGHSKWATIKHQKGAKDQARAKKFAKLIRQIEVAAREGGSDQESNANLRTMYQKARDSSVPVDTIERAIKRGAGELDGVRYEPVAYEGYAPAGVALYVECLTDNRNRTGSDVRSTFSKLGGSLAEPGAVAWQFDRRGVVILPGSVDEEVLMTVVLEAGADDVADDEGSWRVVCDPSDLTAVRSALEAAGLPFDTAEVTMVPNTIVALGTADDARKVLRLVDALDDLDDVQDVYANFDVPEEILELVGE
ncbi:MAG TPA: YebC/PmpR family DNA-binding transcriptional regulator [Acidimicrobiales bacterium]